MSLVILEPKHLCWVKIHVVNHYCF